MVRRILIIKHF